MPGPAARAPGAGGTSGARSRTRLTASIVGAAPRGAATRREPDSALVLCTVMGSLRELLGARELLRTFVARDLQVRYKGSALGILWSLLNPALMMGVYTAVFSSIMRNHITDFPVFFMAGFLPWTFFATALQIGSFSLLSNSSLLQKVYFPREVLPISITLANLANLGLAFVAFFPLGLYLRGFTVPGLLGVLPITL